MNLHLINDVPDGLTRRARSFISAHGIKVDTEQVEQHRQWWLDREVPAAVIDRMAAYQERWGGLLLPPASQYDGGPKYFDPDAPEGTAPEGWWFEAGMQRTAVPFAFMIGPAGEFGIHADRWTPLHATVEGWVESLALSHHASMWAKQITKVIGDDVDRIVLDAYEPVREVMGLADTWWRGADSLVAIYSGEAECFSSPRSRTALIYSGLDDWGLHGGVEMTEDGGNVTS
ncbi:MULTISPECIES: hypothetical protein [unclassified Streptomyces]|uniref:hypothetical protein n=1 Tax=unclassified Streptomyces TaxID=2593676 RepID=UPI000DDACDA3|nr:MULTISPECIES: hypothetical protein [unclassified Streptomyces]QZZ25777.1 hypothetical protein A7X85_05505 [Streptomyces sp. ST1015]